MHSAVCERGLLHKLPASVGGGRGPERGCGCARAQAENETTKAQVLALRADTARIGALVSAPAELVAGAPNGASSYGAQVWPAAVRNESAGVACMGTCVGRLWLFWSVAGSCTFCAMLAVTTRLLDRWTARAILSSA